MKNHGENPPLTFPATNLDSQGKEISQPCLMDVLCSFYSNPSQEAAIYSCVVLNRKPAMLQPWVEDVLFASTGQGIYMV
jgi:hypothetical protein